MQKQNSQSSSSDQTSRRNKNIKDDLSGKALFPLTEGDHVSKIGLLIPCKTAGKPLGSIIRVPNGSKYIKAQLKYQLEGKVKEGKDFFEADKKKAEKSETKLVDAIIYIDGLMVRFHNCNKLYGGLQIRHCTHTNKPSIKPDEMRNSRTHANDCRRALGRKSLT